MKRTTFSVLFYIKGMKLLGNGEAPIMCRISGYINQGKKRK